MRNQVIFSGTTGSGADSSGDLCPSPCQSLASPDREEVLLLTGRTSLSDRYAGCTGRQRTLPQAPWQTKYPTASNSSKQPSLDHRNTLLILHLCQASCIWGHLTKRGKSYAKRHPKGRWWLTIALSPRHILHCPVEAYPTSNVRDGALGRQYRVLLWIDGHILSRVIEFFLTD